MRRSAQLTVLSLALALACTPPLLATTYQVGPGRTYTTLQQVAPLLGPGDVVEVDGNATYPGDVVFTNAGTPDAKITIRGVRSGGLRPVISGGTNTITFETPWPYDEGGADHYVLEGFELTGGTFRCLYHQADDLAVRDVLVHGCPAHGILGADEGSGSLLLERVEVYGCGNGTSQHQIYMATDEVAHPGSVFRMQHCYLHDGTGGNNVKSRAERNEIYYNWIEGAVYHELELIGPDGGDGGNPGLKREDSDVVGNVLVKRNTFSVTRVGGDGTGETDGRYRFVNNTIVAGSSAVFRIFDGIESIQMHNNVIWRDGGAAVNVTRTVEASWTTGVELIAGSNNWVATGATNVPSQWTGTITGADPGFNSFAGDDLRPAAGSPLVNAGAAVLAGPPGFPFPSPLARPGFEPPLATVPDEGIGRGRLGAIDVGAFERGTGWLPVSILVDAAGNGVLEPGETATVQPSWANASGSAAAPTGALGPFTGPVATGYTIADGTAAYGALGDHSVGSCAETGNCYALLVSAPSSRPVHWDATATETLSTGGVIPWTIHVGGGFSDVAPGFLFAAQVEAVLHAGVTVGFADGTYRPAASVTRAQMAMFLARGLAGSDAAVPASGSLPAAWSCTTGGVSLFSDVLPTDAHCRHVHYVASLGVTQGCTATAFCPAAEVTRAQMAMFVARAIAGGDANVPSSLTVPGSGLAYSCEAAAPRLHFSDIAAADLACRHAHYLWARGVVDGCTTTAFCPAPAVSRGQMAKFLANGLGLSAY